MANIKISALPSYTGSAADLRWFVMNNSGNTETFKYSGYSAQLIPSSGADSYKTLNSSGATGARSIAIGYGSYASGNDSVSIGNMFGNAIGTNSVAIGRHPYPPGNSNTIIGSGAYVYGNNNICIGHETSVNSNGIVLGSNTTRANGNYSMSIGHANEQNYGEYSGIFGYNNRIGNFTIGSTTYSSSGSYHFLLSDNSKIGFVGANYTGMTIVGGNNNIIISSGNTNAIYGGSGNVISGATSGVTLIGLSGINSGLVNDLTYTNNYHALRTYSTRVQSISSGNTFTCNLNNGGKAQYYLTGNTTIDITNVRDGQSFIIKTQTDGNYTITWTSTGYTLVFEGGIKDPGNTTTDLFVFEVFGTTIYGNRRHNYS